MSISVPRMTVAETMTCSAAPPATHKAQAARRPVGVLQAQGSAAPATTAARSVWCWKGRVWQRSAHVATRGRLR
eukprot:scaffold53887_cov57-Phaeocystis_antarctica.AAC.3